MRLRVIAAAVLLLGVTALGSAQSLENSKQLTHGGRNAVAYWSPDGSQIIFQSTRDGHKCDQVYLMNADGSNVRMVSTGKGVATSGYFLPDGEHILYASTHEAGAACPPHPSRSKGNVRPVYSGYDIYLAKTDGEIVKKLTDTNGYDAEATVNWATGRIVYTSMASGDLDLWSMDLEGRNKTRLTTAEGYDGGAFYSRDGSQLVWHAHHPLEPNDTAKYRGLLGQNLTMLRKMELYVSDQYGTGARRITNFGCASFAPQFTPDNGKIVFSTNMDNCDTREFDLYVISLDGSGLEQLTRFYEFTSFPAFSPDGKKILFTSTMDAAGKYDTNIFVADWVE